jgi:hypothetical protein
VKADILEGTPINERVQSIQRIFPKNYCAFEQLLVLRILYFLLFNLINAYSLCFVVSDYDE